MIHVIEPHEMKPELLSRMEEFRFPSSDKRELYYDRQYNHRAIYVIDATKNMEINATARIISKTSYDEKLPIEFGKVIEKINTTAPVKLRRGSFFKIEILPVCEVGGLKVADTLSFRSRHSILDAVMKTCHAVTHAKKFRSFFLTSISNPCMERLYHNRVFFNPVAKLEYGSSTWTAFWRWPFTSNFLNNCFSIRHTDIPNDAYIIPN